MVSLSNQKSAKKRYRNFPPKLSVFAPLREIFRISLAVVPRFARLELAVENAALAARLFDANLDAANLGAAKLSLDLVANPVGDMFRQ